jgi:SAM-dependent methyltransferase
VLDVGCAKGFLVKDLVDAGLDAYGVDISEYAVLKCPSDIVGRLHQGDAVVLPFPDASFDLVLSINTLHNLNRAMVKRALQEIMRVCRGKAFVQVDSYMNAEGKARFEEWVLTANYHGYPDEWLELFTEAGYLGDYDWTVV